MNKQEILDNLPNFTGSETFTKWSVLFRNDVLTEGAKFIAHECFAYWLMDAIASHQHDPKVRAEGFQVWELSRHEVLSGHWLLSCEDGNDNDVTEQVIEYSDFPLDGIKLYACRNELGGVVICLPSEY